MIFPRLLKISQACLLILLLASQPALAAGDWETALGEARMSLTEGDYSKAVKKYEKALSLGPDELAEMDIVFILGVIYTMQEEYVKAVPRLDRAIELLEKEGLDIGRLTEAYGQRALAASKLGDAQGAAYFESKAAELISGQTGPDKIWLMDEATGVLTHNRTHSEFPQNLFGFERGDIQAYADDGSDVSVSYGLMDGQDRLAILTIYLSYYSNTGLGDYVEGVKASVVGRRPLTTRTIDEVQYFRPASESYPKDFGAFRGIYAYADGDSLEEIGTEIWIAQEVNFFLKIRYTYALAEAEQAVKALEDFLENTDFLISNHLLALVASEKLGLEFCLDPAVDGSSPNTLVETIDMTVTVSVMLEVSSKTLENEGATPEAAPKRCLIDLNTGTNQLKLVNTLFLPEDENSDPVLGQALYEFDLYFENWNLDSKYFVYESTILPAVLAEEGGDLGPYYFLTREKDGVVEFYALFNGVPGVREAKQSAIRIISGRSSPKLRAYEDEEGNLTTEFIGMPETMDSEE